MKLMEPLKEEAEKEERKVKEKFAEAELIKEECEKDLS